MKFTLSWLKEFLDTQASAEAIVEKLTAIGLEVESVENPAEQLADFTVAEILAAERHPDADKLQVCKVMTHTGERQIVCGAPNARAGLKVVLADIGVTIPNGGFQIKQAKIRGVESSGMLCSADELGIGGDAAGIIELPATARVGDKAAGALGLDDIIIDIAITPNRGDCLGIYGVARDLAAAGMGKLRPLNREPVTGGGDAERGIQLQTPDCKLFVGRLIRGVKNGESPDWLKKRLESVGLRPISALVDVTNYMTVAYGRPLHVYDADKLTGDIIVRTSEDGEAVEALNDKAYTLSEGLCVIADESGAALGIGGVVGGTSTGVTGATKNVFLEAAWFEPQAIARAGRVLQVDSDARYRFERCVDPAFTQTGAEVATRMILALCGGEASELTIAGQPPSLTRKILFTPQSVEQLGGLQVDDEEASDILEALGCSIEMGFDGWQVSTPSWRPDLEDKPDLVEEILRIKGYDAIPETPLPQLRGAEEENSPYAKSRSVRRTLAAQGLKECCHFAFVSRAQAEQFATQALLVSVVNPISADLDTMRPSLLPALLQALAKGTARGITDNALFEVGVVFAGVAPEQQPLAAAGVRMGHDKLHWSGKPHVWDVYDARAELEAALAAAGFGGKAQVASGAPAWYHPGKSGTLSVGKTVLGYFGVVHPAIQRFFDLEQEVVAFECFLGAVPAARKKARREALKLSDFQPSARDFAFVVDAGIAADELLGAVRMAERQLIRDVTLFDVYAGKGIPEGKKSLAISVTLQADDRTLSEDDLTRVHQAIILAAEKKCGAELR